MSLSGPVEADGTVPTSGGGGGGTVWGTITGTLSAQTDLQTELDTKLEFPITIADTTGLQVALDSKAVLPITIADVTNLQSTLDSKAVYPVLTANINDDLVTFAKLQNASAASQLLGRGSAAGAGDFEEIVLGTNLSFSGTTLNASGGGGSTPTGTGFRHVTGGVEDAASKLVDTANINNDQVTNAKLANVNTATIKGRTTAGTGDPEDLTTAQTTALLDVFTSGNKGLVPASGGGTTNFLRADGTFAAPAGGGGSGQLAVVMTAGDANVTWTNMPAAVTFFQGSHRGATRVDLTPYTQVRLVVNKQGVAGAAASIVRLRYITAFSTTVGNWLTIGSSELSLPVNNTNTVTATSWINLVAGAIADVFITLDGSGGDGALDPVFGKIVAQFR